MRRGGSDTMPCALAIGGLDPGGGAGLAADLRALSAAGAFGCGAVAVITVQSTAGLRSVVPVEARTVAAQALEVLAHQRVRAIKIGALGTAENVRAVARLLDKAEARGVPVVLDTPMAPSRAAAGRARLTALEAVTALKRDLLPRATLVTVNVAEAEALVGERVLTVGEAHDAARALARLGARAALVKGGHLAGPSAIDVLADAHEVVELRARRLPAGAVHGTGCTFASLVAGRLAVRERGEVASSDLVGAVRWAKRVHHAALARAVRVGSGMRVIVF
jgi:hydroxymethylpyrimidine/phosphomethylpyrimidine kinase